MMQRSIRLDVFEGNRGDHAERRLLLIKHGCIPQKMKRCAKELIG